MANPTMPAAVQTFIEGLPPSTSADAVKLLKDFVVAAEFDLDEAIQTYGPQFPFVRGIMKHIINETLDNGVAALEEKISVA